MNLIEFKRAPSLHQFKQSLSAIIHIVLPVGKLVRFYCACSFSLGIIQRILQIDSNCIWIGCLSLSFDYYATVLSVICLVILLRINESDSKWKRGGNGKRERAREVKWNCVTIITTVVSIRFILASFFRMYFSEMTDPLLNLICNFIVIVWFQFNAVQCTALDTMLFAYILLTKSKWEHFRMIPFANMLVAMLYSQFFPFFWTYLRSGKYIFAVGGFTFSFVFSVACFWILIWIVALLKVKFKTRLQKRRENMPWMTLLSVANARLSNHKIQFIFIKKSRSFECEWCYRLCQTYQMQ